ncbi:MAG: hypothetical protein JWN14_1333 [Chthonomonadales bacterium]|nr:hypothetical protein [Chthonomonadales bacterium]
MNEATLLDSPSPRTDAGEDAQRRSEERTTLQYWFANEDVYTSAYVRKWLERTPSDEVGDVLAAIAQYAHPEPHSLLWMAFHALTAMLTTAEIISEKSPAGRKSGIRAAMLLANRNDLRALGPLVHVFEPHWFWKGRYQEAIEAALLHLLSHAPEETEWTPYRADLRTLAEAIRQIGRGRQELSARQADLLIISLKRLASAADADTTILLQTIASTEARTPHRARVQDEARKILSGSGASGPEPS